MITNTISKKGYGCKYDMIRYDMYDIYDNKIQCPFRIKSFISPLTISDLSCDIKLLWTAWVRTRLCKLQKKVQVIKFTSCLPMVGGSLRVH